MTTTIRADEQTFVPAPSDLRATTDRLLHAMTEAGLDDPRWEVAGPIVTAAAQLLREALGGAPAPDRCGRGRRGCRTDVRAPVVRGGAGAELSRGGYSGPGG